MNLRPANDKIIVKPDSIEEITAGDIIIPQTVLDAERKAITRGVVVAVGPSCGTFFSDDGIKKEELKVGDRVIFAKFAGAEFRDGKSRQEYRILLDENVICRIDGEVGTERPDTRKSMAK